MTYEEELKYKKCRVEDAFKRIGHIDLKVDEIIPCNSVNGYRNKAQYPIEIENSKLKAGFYANKSHRIIPCRDCLLQPAEFQKGIDAFAKWAKEYSVTSYDEKTGRGLIRHLFFRKGFGTGEVMACAVINSNSVPGADRLVSLLRENVNGLSSVVLNINKKNTNVVLSQENIVLWGNDTISDILLGNRFVISPNSFYQVNHNQCEKLYLKAGEYADLTGGETVIDMYCGVGTVGLSLAKNAKELIGVEIVEQAVENARKNAQINSFDNARFICSDAGNAAKLLNDEGIKPDLVILDPPRKGCSTELINASALLSPEKIVYISCDSATLARDLSAFADKNYIAQKACAVDMFPRTPHVETVVLMSRVKK